MLPQTGFGTELVIILHGDYIKHEDITKSLWCCGVTLFADNTENLIMHFMNQRHKRTVTRPPLVNVDRASKAPTFQEI